MASGPSISPDMAQRTAVPSPSTASSNSTFAGAMPANSRV